MQKNNQPAVTGANKPVQARQWQQHQWYNGGSIAAAVVALLVMGVQRIKKC